MNKPKLEVTEDDRSSTVHLPRGGSVTVSYYKVQRQVERPRVRAATGNANKTAPSWAPLAKQATELAMVEVLKIREQTSMLRARVEQMGFKGRYVAGAIYRQGNLVAHDGGVFCCMTDTTTTAPGDWAAWKLCVKRARK